MTAVQGTRPLHIEVAVHAMCPTPLEHLRNQWREFLQNTPQIQTVHDGHQIDVSALPEELSKTCLKASIVDDERDEVTLLPGHSCFKVHAFVLSEEEVSTEELEPTGGDDEWTAGCDSLPLPHRSLDGVWENLIFEPEIKRCLLDYAKSALFFADKSVSSHVVHWNRILLLHGLPGTGKTSLCRSLAHKLAIRLGDRFTRATLLEIHSHSLFSKWFSTSGKLVSTLFQMVRDMVQDDPSTLVCILIDEVESLASSRNNSSSGDPSDAMRAVNSLLTSLDRLRSFPNVLVLATTNLTASVDDAFVDRVDLKLHIGMPILKARYQILHSCLQELLRVGIITCDGCKIEPYHSSIKTEANELTGLLLACAEQAEGLSGRSLRRLPLQAHARYLQALVSVSTKSFLEALSLAIQMEQISRHRMAL